MKYLALVLLMAPTLASANTIEVTYFLTSKHFASKNNNGENFNVDHKFISAEYRIGENGVSASTFVNSFDKRSYMVDYSRYWQPYNNIEASVRVGAVTGYDAPNECLQGDKTMKVCPVISVGVAYTRNNYFIPKLSIIPKAVTLSFSARF